MCVCVEKKKKNSNKMNDKKKEYTKNEFGVRCLILLVLYSAIFFPNNSQ